MASVTSGQSHGHAQHDSISSAGGTVVGSPPSSPLTSQKGFYHVSIDEATSADDNRAASPNGTRDPTATILGGGGGVSTTWGRASQGSSSSTREKPGRRSRTLLPRVPVLPSKTGSWFWEIVSLALALVALGSIVGVLASFDGKPLPDWPYAITLNALVALLATVAHASLVLPLSSAISQLKWIRFRTGRWPLSDLELFDEASRGPSGSFLLLWKRRGG